MFIIIIFIIYVFWSIFPVNIPDWCVTLAQLVKASVGQADVQRFEPHLGHNAAFGSPRKVGSPRSEVGTSTCLHSELSTRKD